MATDLTGGNAPADPDDPSTFPLIFNAMLDELDAKAVAADVVLKAGSTMTGTLTAPNVQLEVDTLAGTGTVDIDFTGDAYRTQALTGDVTFTGSNYASGRSVTARLTSGVSGTALAFPFGWKFVSSKPTAIPANKTAVLALTCFGSADSDVVAAYAVEV